MEVEEASDFAAKFAEGTARPMQQSPLCEACCKIPLKWLLEDITRSFILFETIKPLINPKLRALWTNLTVYSSKNRQS